MAQLTEGETRRGKVTSITNFGAFVDLGGADGLIHVSELSWSRVGHPSDVLEVGEEVDVYVLDLDWKRKRIALSLRKLQPDPWTMVDDHYRAGQLVEGLVTRVVDFGAFVQLDLGVEGLLHVSEMIGTPELSPSDIVHAGETLLVKIIRIESQRERIALSAKQVQRDEWERWVAERQAAADEEEKAASEAEVETTAEAAADEGEAESPVEEEEAALEAEVETAAEAAADEEEAESPVEEEEAASEAEVETAAEAAADEEEAESPVEEPVEEEEAPPQETE
jgi:small subunit ribosomal protein S1